MEMNMMEKATGFSTPLEGALWCAEQGFRVFPLRRGGDPDNQKRPAISEWESAATTDAKRIAQWEAQFPGANWAVAAGASGLTVIDVDKKHGKDGHAALEELSILHGDLPATLRVRTASGQSVHHYFRGASRSSNSTLATGIDTRAAGGYVVAPGSIFRDIEGRSLGQYFIEDNPAVAVLPEWVDRALGDTRNKAPAGAVAARIPSGMRDSTLTSMAGSMRQRAMDYEEILVALAAVNSRRCDPPMDTADVERIARSVCRYAPGSAKSIEAALLLERTAPPPALDRLLCAADIVPETILRRPWVAPGRYLRGAISLTVGPGGASKSSFALAEGIAISLGRADLIGMRYAQVPKTVWYYNAEDPTEELRRRVAAVCGFHGIPLKALTRFFYGSGVDGTPLKLAASDNRGAVVMNEPILAWMEEQIRRVSAELVVLDPWAGLHSCDENANAEIDALMRALTRMATRCGAALHIVHHSKKLGLAEGSGDAEIARGASSLVAAARYVCTLRGMSEKDAKRHGIPQDHRHNYCRLDDAKLNYSQASDTAQWFYRESVNLPGVPKHEPAQAVAVLKPMDLEQIQAEETGTADALAGLLDNLDESSISVVQLAKIVMADPELSILFEGSPSTVRRSLLAIFKHPITMPGGRCARLVNEKGTATVTIEEDFSV